MVVRVISKQDTGVKLELRRDKRLGSVSSTGVGAGVYSLNVNKV